MNKGPYILLLLCLHTLASSTIACGCSLAFHFLLFFPFWVGALIGLLLYLICVAAAEIATRRAEKANVDN